MAYPGLKCTTNQVINYARDPSVLQKSRKAAIAYHFEKGFFNNNKSFTKIAMERAGRSRLKVQLRWEGISSPFKNSHSPLKQQQQQTIVFPPKKNVFSR
jgi:hypothetical protein